MEQIAAAPAAGRHSGPAIRTFERIADAWKLSVDERRRILGMPASTYFRVREIPERARLSRDQLERISHVLAIYKALHILLPRADVADAWLSLPNRDFGGQPAKKSLATGSFSDLIRVRQYVDAQRGW